MGNQKDGLGRIYINFFRKDQYSRAEVDYFLLLMKEMLKKQDGFGAREVSHVLLKPDLATDRASLASSARPRAAADPEAKWRVQAEEWRQELGVPASFSLIRKHKLAFRGVQMTERTRVILDLVLANIAKQHRLVKWPPSKKWLMRLVKSTVVDVSQNPCRRKFSTEEHLHTMCTSSILVHLGLQRAILPSEMLWLQGHNPSSTVLPSTIPSGSVRALAGEGMALPCIGLVIWCLHQVKQFPRQDSEA
ncbi:unnamed protein product [Symbiodinium sp. CCMP2592]|nr:unnamed protein product [Symbiodinium sp. CCMP2592]